MNFSKDEINIFITGGTGFFGKSILAYLKQGNFSEISLTILSRNPEKFLKKNPEFRNMPKINFEMGDVRNFSFPPKKFDYIIHGAAPSHSLPQGEMRDIIVNGTKRVIDFAKIQNIKKMLFISSGAVYGNMQNATTFKENMQCFPTTEYAIGKYDAEKMCIESQIPVVIARCFAFVGQYLDFDSHIAIGNFISNCLKNIPIEITGTGTPLRSYLYADDLVEWLFTILFKGCCGEIYNVGSDKPISIRQLAELTGQTLNSKFPPILHHGSDTRQASSNYIPNIEKCKIQLGLSVKTSLQDAIIKTVQHIDG